MAGSETRDASSLDRPGGLGVTIFSSFSRGATASGVGNHGARDPTHLDLNSAFFSSKSSSVETFLMSAPALKDSVHRRAM